MVLLSKSCLPGAARRGLQAEAAQKFADFVAEFIGADSVVLQCSNQGSRHGRCSELLRLIAVRGWLMTDGIQHRRQAMAQARNQILQAFQPGGHLAAGGAVSAFIVLD